jgi:MscS family membrane protein
VQVLQLPAEPVDVKRFAYALLKMLVTFDVAWFAFNMVSLLEAYTRPVGQPHRVDARRSPAAVHPQEPAGLRHLPGRADGHPEPRLLHLRPARLLGIGGLAVALAAKDTLANVFGSIAIIVDRPFHIGDTIKAGDLEGKVEEVGFRSTKIRTLDKSLISVPNSVITNMAVNNLSRMVNRRIRFSIGLTYDTRPEQLQMAVQRIRTLLVEHEAIHNDGLLVHFTEFGASSLDILVQCFTITTDIPEHLSIREEVCLKIMNILEELGLQIAFPSRTVYLRDTEGDELPLAAKQK